MSSSLSDLIVKIDATLAKMSAQYEAVCKRSASFARTVNYRALVLFLTEYDQFKKMDLNHNFRTTFFQSVWQYVEKFDIPFKNKLCMLHERPHLDTEHPFASNCAIALHIAQNGRLATNTLVARQLCEMEKENTLSQYILCFMAASIVHECMPAFNLDPEDIFEIGTMVSQTRKTLDVARARASVGDSVGDSVGVGNDDDDDDDDDDGVGNGI